MACTFSVVSQQCALPFALSILCKLAKLKLDDLAALSSIIAQAQLIQLHHDESKTRRTLSMLCKCALVIGFHHLLLSAIITA
jgi:hypothetical protein